MPRKYKNPPVKEVVCEFRFEQDFEWNLSFPGLIYSELKDLFPKRDQSKQFELSIDSTQAKSIKQTFQAVDRLLLTNETENIKTQIGPYLLAVNHLRPYSSWNTFIPVIERAVASFIKVTEAKLIKRSGLRYINIFSWNENIVKLEEFFNFYPFLGPGLPQQHRAFISGVILDKGNGNLLKLELQSALPEPGFPSSFVNDLDYYSETQYPASIEQMMKWLSSAHAEIEDTFEKTITEELRKTFGGIDGTES